MRISKGDKTIEVPNLLIFVGIIVVDNIVANVCRASSLRKLSKKDEDEES